MAATTHPVVQEGEDLMNEQALGGVVRSAQFEASTTFPTLPSFSDLARQFLANLPEVLVKTIEPNDTNTGQRPGWGS